MVKNLSYFLLILFLSIGVLSIAKADDAPLILMAKGVMPVNNKTIRLIRERVDIRLFADNMGGYADVEAALTFRNTGKAQKILMGFPGSQIDEGYETEYNSTTINGQKFPVKYYEQGDKPGNSWHCWEVPFKRGEEITVISNYKFKKGFSATQAMFFYPLETGKYWKGEIEEAIINLHLEGIEVWSLRTVLPKDFKVSGEESIVWNFKHFEPNVSSNIEVYYVIPGSFSIWPENNCKSIEEKVDLVNALKCYEAVQPTSDAKIWSEFYDTKSYYRREGWDRNRFENRILNYSRNMGEVKYSEYKAERLRQELTKHLTSQ